MVVGQGYATIWEELELRGDIRVDTQPSLSLTPNASNTEIKRVVCANSSGQQRFYEVSRDSIFDENGQVVQYLEHWRDVTEHEDMLRRLLFQEQLHSVGRLVASVVEEVRQPLHHAMARLEQFATDTTLQVEVQQQGRQAHQEVGLVLRICESVRHLYQAAEADWRCIQVNNLLHRLQEFVTPLFYYHNVELHMELDNSLDLVYMQPDAIYQVLLSLLINAQEAMPQGGTVLVRTQVLAAEDCCLITIRDEGIGMSEEELTHAFKPFYARMMQGVVPDLYFSQQVIEKHGGRVEIQSRQHVGTTVHVYLPFHDECRKKREKREKTL
jgi:signal transduction histidine kinase